VSFIGKTFIYPPKERRDKDEEAIFYWSDFRIIHFLQLCPDDGSKRNDGPERNDGQCYGNNESNVRNDGEDAKDDDETDAGPRHKKDVEKAISGNRSE
jgi:hypothetical protein